MTGDRRTISGVVALALALFALPPSLASAQAWIRDPGHVYAKLGYRLIRASSIYRTDGSRNRIGDGYRQHALGFYTELGVIEQHLAISLDGDLFRRSVLVDQGRTTGLGDLRLGLYTGLVTAPFHLALGVQLGLPTGDPAPDAGPNASIDDQLLARSLPTGDGEWDVAIRLYAGHSFSGRDSWPLRHYVVAEIGGWIRGLAYVDLPPEFSRPGRSLQLVFRGELGSTPKQPGWDRLSVAFRLTGVHPIAPRRGNGTASTVGLGAGVRYVSPGLDVSVRTIDTLRVGFSGDGAVVAANVPAAIQWQLYASWER